MTLRGEMQLYHLMAAPGAFLSFWCFFFCFVFEPDHHICYYVDLIILSFIYAYKRVYTNLSISSRMWM